ncbi:resistin-like beta [Anomaloglossus baeobatrachus]|uniref:resistin-like beta n=1 Tax=Anomaloglossus baeobatrachus TaxID=238106 RepID=UPI003F5061BB
MLRRKPSLTLIILSIVVVSVHSCCPAQCDLNDVLSLNNLMNAMATKIVEKSKIVCTNVSEKGALVSCPPDYIPYSCSCGSACGSWDIRNENTCHCQCNNIDWTSARCCKIIYG